MYRVCRVTARLLVLAALSVTPLLVCDARAGQGQQPERSGSSPECAAHDAAVIEGKLAPRRIALSIGNAKNFNHPLQNAAHDSSLVGDTLVASGWDVTHKVDLDRQGMQQTLDAFADKVDQLCETDVALFYFAGYGFEIERVSYLFPTDLDVTRKDTARTEAEQDEVLAAAISLRELAAAFKAHKGPKIIILDTCRDNPFRDTRRAIDPEKLAPMRLPENTLYAYSAEPGDIALDAGENPDYGPYAWALAKAIREVEGTAEQVFRRVRTEVVAFTSKALHDSLVGQRPFVESSLSGKTDVYLGRPPRAASLVDTKKADNSQGGKADTRVALVIANANYQSANALKNPPRDGKAIAATLRKLGFEVFEKNDANQNDIDAALNDFGKKARKADWAMVYFAGHGMEIGGQTYILPTDVKLERDVDANDEAVRIDKIMEKLERTQGLGVIVLDACRNNPFERSMRKIERRGRDARTGGGLGRADVDTVGVLVVYSARHGTTADDGEGEFSPFAEALLKTIEQPGLEVNMVFRKVRDRVLAATNQEQEPFTYGSLPGREFYFVPPR